MIKSSHCLRLLFSLVLTAASLCAQAPESLAGKVFHDQGVGVIRNVWACITALRNDGSCSFLLTAGGSTINLQAQDVPFIGAPLEDGTWTYQKTGVATGLLTIMDSKGRADNLTLTFVTPTAGNVRGSGYIRAAGLGGPFTLTDQASANASTILNASLRGSVAPGRPLIAGFVVPGSDLRNVLIRVVGPSPSQFGITGVWADPEFRLVRSGEPNPASNTPSPYYGDWSAPSRSQSDPTVILNSSNPTAGFKKIFAAVGAFPLVEGSKDAASLVGLLPGAYTVVCTSPAGDVGGDVIIEIYSLP